MIGCTHHTPIPVIYIPLVIALLNLYCGYHVTIHDANFMVDIISTL